MHECARSPRNVSRCACIRIERKSRTSRCARGPVRLARPRLAAYVCPPAGRPAGGHHLEGNGVVPDIEGALDRQELLQGVDAQRDAALKYLERGDFAFVHLEGPDECGHAGNAAEKAEAISRFDARVVAPLKQALAGQDVAFVVTCDHFTPIAEKTHTPDAVPFLLWRAGLEPSGADCFSEAQARASGLVLETGHELLPWVLRQLA